MTEHKHCPKCNATKDHLLLFKLWICVGCGGAMVRKCSGMGYTT